MTLLLFLFACSTTNPDEKTTDPFATSAPPPEDNIGLVEGGTLIAWGWGGLYVEDAGAFRKLADLDVGNVVTSVNASGDTVTLLEGCTATVLDLATGEVVMEHTFSCDTEDAIQVTDALYRDGILWAAQENIIRVESDGTETVFESIWVDRLQSDQGLMYLVRDYGREGNEITPVEPSELPATGSGRFLGWGVQARGPLAFSYYGEEGNSSSGGFGLNFWDSSEQYQSFTLGDGLFAGGLDVLAGQAALLRVHSDSDWIDSGALLDHSGATIDTLDDCPSPRLAWYVDTIVGWCAASDTTPLRRITWAWDGTTWARADQQDYSEDVFELILLEEGD